MDHSWPGFDLLNSFDYCANIRDQIIEPSVIAGGLLLFACPSVPYMVRYLKIGGELICLKKSARFQWHLVILQAAILAAGYSIQKLKSVYCLLLWKRKSKVMTKNNRSTNEYLHEERSESRFSRFVSVSFLLASPHFPYIVRFSTEARDLIALDKASTLAAIRVSFLILSSLSSFLLPNAFAVGRFF